MHESPNFTCRDDLQDYFVTYFISSMILLMSLCTCLIQDALPVHNFINVIT